MKNTIELIKEELDKLKVGDLSDIGNSIGIAIGKSIIENEGKFGFDDASDFISGVKHGVSLVDGTHFK